MGTLNRDVADDIDERESYVIFSYTQISNYLRCPRSHRLRYLEGWQERGTRAGLVFERCFEQALSSFYFRASRV